MNLEIPKSLLDEVEELISHYPQKRSASLMLLHAFQEHFGHVSKESVEWIAAKLDLRPINVYELVTFYPMFREEPAGRHVIKVCRTLSCALGGVGNYTVIFARNWGSTPRFMACKPARTENFPWNLWSVWPAAGRLLS